MTGYHPTGHDVPEHHHPHLAGEDEWGFFDPQRHGLAAVRARLGVMLAPEPSTADNELARQRSARYALDDE